MPLTDSMEKPPTAESAAGSIAVFSNTYARLPERFFARLAPTPAPRPHLIKFNESLASELGVNARGREPDELAAVFAGNVTPAGAEPIAMAYAGHQFGSFVPQLGDGRAILLGEVLDRNGKRRDVQLKGAGRTPFSRRGDGRAALGPVLREYLVSEAMHALGSPTTRALAAVSTGEPVYRDRPLPGAVLTRVASSHIRVGTFQYFAARAGGCDKGRGAREDDGGELVRPPRAGFAHEPARRNSAGDRVRRARDPEDAQRSGTSDGVASVRIRHSDRLGRTV